MGRLYKRRSNEREKRNEYKESKESGERKEWIEKRLMLDIKWYGLKKNALIGMKKVGC